MKTYCVALLIAAACAAAVSAQAPASSPQRSYTTTATAILVDVVVRDKKGQPVTDLGPDDFELAEDAVSQKIDSFTRITRGGGIGVGVAWKSPTSMTTVSGAPQATAPESAAPANPADRVTTAFVFDHLSPESLRLAQKATLDYIPLAGDSDVDIGVFATDPGVRVIQAYTTDRTRVRQAIARVGASGSSLTEDNAERSDALRARRRSIDETNQQAMVAASATSGAAAAAAGPEIGEREMERRLIQTELNIMRSSENLERDYRGYDTTRTLLAIVDTLADFPGRKTIVFFSQGLPVSPALSAKLDTVISAANRANVTTYAIDANGLSTKSSTAALMKEMQTFTEDRASQLASGNDTTQEPLTMAFERVEDSLKLDSRTGLARLAEDTGGFLVEQTNNLPSAFKRIDEDNRFHYLLTYTPSNTNFDGKFRTIAVKVRRPGLQVFARKGYRATPSPIGIATAAYEEAALSILDRAPLPNAFPISAAGFSFPDPRRQGLTPVLVQLTTDRLRYQVDPQRSTYTAQATVVVRVRDGRGKDLQRVSQQYALAGDAKDVEAAKKGEILFYRELDLPPGVYTLESIVMDGTSREGSARMSTLTVEAAGAPVRMSSLVIVGRTEQVGEGPAAGEAIAPLYVGRTLLYPNLGQPITKATAGELPFYFTLYGDVAHATAEAQLLRSGQLLAGAPVRLPPTTSSKVQHVGRLPIANLPSGTYELRIRVLSEGHEVSRTAYFTLQ